MSLHVTLTHVYASFLPFNGMIHVLSTHTHTHKALQHEYDIGLESRDGGLGEDIVYIQGLLDIHIESF